LHAAHRKLEASNRHQAVTRVTVKRSWRPP